jgi:hypothetical protein
MHLPSYSATSMTGCARQMGHGNWQSQKHPWKNLSHKIKEVDLIVVVVVDHIHCCLHSKLCRANALLEYICQKWVNNGVVGFIIKTMWWWDNDVNNNWAHHKLRTRQLRDHFVDERSFSQRNAVSATCHKRTILWLQIINILENNPSMWCGGHWGPERELLVSQSIWVESGCWLLVVGRRGLDDCCGMVGNVGCCWRPHYDFEKTKWNWGPRSPLATLCCWGYWHHHLSSNCACDREKTGFWVFLEMFHNSGYINRSDSLTDHVKISKIGIIMRIFMKLTLLSLQMNYSSKQ